MKVNLSAEELRHLYWEQNKSLSQIGAIFGVIGGAVWLRMRKHGIPRRAAGGGDTSHHTKLNPSLELSPELSYILGVLKGDGFCYCTGNNKNIVLNVNDKDFATSFAEGLRRINLHPKVFSLAKYESSTTKWRVNCVSEVFYDWYKSLTFEQLKTIAVPYFLEFFKGFYESEGNFKVQKSCNGFTLRVVNTNYGLLEWLQEELNKRGYPFTLRVVKGIKDHLLRGRVIHRRRPLFVLGLHRRNEVRDLLLKISPCIPRKRWGKDD